MKLLKKLYFSYYLDLLNLNIKIINININLELITN